MFKQLVNIFGICRNAILDLQLDQLLKGTFSYAPFYNILVSIIYTNRSCNLSTFIAYVNELL